MKIKKINMYILEKTMSEMGDSFTSCEFNKRAVLNGYPAKSLKQNGLSDFIKKHADNAYKYSKTWVKKKNKNTEMLKKRVEPRNQPIIKSEVMYRFADIDDIINFLKLKGFKIMKPVNNWEEC